jgi:hypothetical protein
MELFKKEQVMLCWVGRTFAPNPAGRRLFDDELDIDDVDAERLVVEERPSDDKSPSFCLLVPPVDPS